MSWLTRLLRRGASDTAIPLLDDGSLTWLGGSTDPAAADTEVVRAIAETGVDLAQVVLVVHLLGLPDELALNEAARLVAEEGYGLTAEQATEASGYKVRVSRPQLLTGLSVAQERSRMAGLAQRLGGSTHGWEALAPESVRSGA